LKSDNRNKGREMRMAGYALAIDIGASGGRHILSHVEGGRLVLEEVYRFPNVLEECDGHLCWSLNTLWSHVISGLRECKRLGKIPTSLGVDTWAVDYVLLNKNKERLGDSIAYRDSRTRPYVDKIPADKLYARTGIAFQPFNSVYQLLSTPPELLCDARYFLMIPDYLHYLLSDRICNEVTNASTTALLDPRTRHWDRAALRMAGLPETLFSDPPLPPGASLGNLRGEIADLVGFDCEVILPATHDTGSAFLAVPIASQNTAILSSGTWSLLGAELDAPLLTEAARNAGFTNELGYGGNIRFLRNIMGLWMVQCIRHELGDRYSYAQLADMALSGATYAEMVDATDPRFLAPCSMIGEIRAALVQQCARLPESNGQLMSCVLHSLAKAYARALADLRTLTGRPMNALHIVGGGCRNHVLNQWTADAAGVPVYTEPDECTALGNVMAQLLARGQWETVAQARECVSQSFRGQTYQPQKGVK
jgi:rhamnulokinase